MGFPGASDSKKYASMQKTVVQILGGEESLEKGMAAPSSILAWRIPRTEEPVRLQSIKWQRVRQDWITNTFTFFIFISSNK